MSSRELFSPKIVQNIVFYLTHEVSLATDLALIWGQDAFPIESSEHAQLKFIAIPPEELNEKRQEDVSGYATVNKIWQDAVERETFSELCLNPSRLVEASIILNGNRRRQKYVRTIRLYDLLPYHSWICDSEANGLNLQAMFGELLSTLSHWAPGPPMKLYIDGVFSRHPYLDRPWCLTSPTEFEKSAHAMLQGPARAVTEVNMAWKTGTRDYVSLVAVCSLLARLPEARKVSIEFGDEGSDTRIDCAEALQLLTHEIDHFTINRAYCSEFYQPDKNSENKLSQALGGLSQRLKKINIMGISVTDELFSLPTLNLEASSLVHWARLEEFNLYYPTHNTPFSLNVDSDETIAAGNPFQRRYLAAARAACEMPQLKNMLIYALPFIDEYFNGFRYSRTTETNTSRAIWASNIGFIPDVEVVSEWQKVSRKHLGSRRLEIGISDCKSALEPLDKSFSY